MSIGAIAAAIWDRKSPISFDIYCFSGGFFGSLSMFHGDGQGGVRAHDLADFGLVDGDVLVGDVDGDGIDDVVIVSPNGQVATLFGDGRGGFRRADPAPMPTGCAPLPVLPDLSGGGH